MDEDQWCHSLCQTDDLDLRLQSLWTDYKTSAIIIIMFPRVHVIIIYLILKGVLIGDNLQIFFYRKHI